ncbi:GNAT family N-acetyltransferase [Methylomarinovum caldicuralii]|uniref:GNAT family N-acetyltransferase n=1 Tax=Methylomarinovum caldicuralii TaxID=438856 RepID=UPI002954953B|nr:GNAT family N-acetyltransferase [Methylomarinovum caldicuralii]
MDSLNDSRVHALFEEVFGVVKARAWWQWKYGDGRGFAFGAWRDETLVAHYAAFPRRIHWRGEVIPAFQVGDVMVKASERGVLTRRGLFQRCAAAFQETWVGYGRPFLLGFGFPNLRAMRLAERLGLYARVDRMHEFRWPPLPDRPRWRSRIRHFRPESDAPLVDALWARMRHDLNGCLTGERCFPFLVHRYLHHPEHRYECLLLEARLLRQPLGLIVLRRDGDRWLWVDWLGGAADLGEALAQARRMVTRLGGKELYTWASTVPAGRLTALGGTATPLEVHVPTGIWTEGPSPESLRERWWLMPGDTDFF